jgi:spore maturation protein CgeB
MFEALACGIPLISAPWSDDENLFPPGCYLEVGTGEQMTSALATLLRDDELAGSLSQQGLHTILERHTCRHRVLDLLAILAELDGAGQAWSVDPQQERIAS